MDSIGQLLSSIWGGIGGAGAGTGTKLLDLVKLALGTYSTVGAERQLGQQRSYLTGLEKLTPQQLAAKVSAATQPLSAGLTQGVGNEVSGYLAERGLSESSPIQAATMAQALAPFYQQNQNTALNLILQQMGIPQEMWPFLTQSPNLIPLLQTIFPGGGVTGVPGNVGAPGSNFPPLPVPPPPTPPVNTQPLPFPPSDSAGGGSPYFDWGTLSNLVGQGATA